MSAGSCGSRGSLRVQRSCPIWGIDTRWSERISLTCVSDWTRKEFADDSRVEQKLRNVPDISLAGIGRETIGAQRLLIVLKRSTLERQNQGDSPGRLNAAQRASHMAGGIITTSRSHTVQPSVFFHPLPMHCPPCCRSRWASMRHVSHPSIAHALSTMVSISTRFQPLGTTATQARTTTASPPSPGPPSAGQEGRTHFMRLFRRVAEKAMDHIKCCQLPCRRDSPVGSYCRNSTSHTPHAPVWHPY